MTKEIDDNSELPTNCLSNETLDSLIELGQVLERIHRRLIASGYLVEGGKIYKPPYNA